MTQLANAVSAINLYPAGDPALTCSLTQSPRLSTARARSSQSASGTGPKDFVVGGGQYVTACGTANFALNAHAPDGVTAPGAAKGTWNVSVPSGSACGKRSLTAEVDCLSVSGTTADTTELVTRASGSLDGLEGTELTVEAIDNTPDQLTRDGGSFTSGPGDFSNASEVTPILHGNINVHDN